MLVLVAQFKPKEKYLLIDENAYSDSELSAVKNLVAAVFRIEHPATPEMVSQLLEQLSEWLIDRPDLRQMFARWIRATLMRKTEYRIVLPELDDLQELNVMLAERIEQWAHEYEAKGVAKGVAEGEAKGEAKGVAKGEGLALQKLLTKRFGAIPSDILAKIAGATPEQIDTWLYQILDANSLDDMF